jgi:hypothetical protein
VIFNKGPCASIDAEAGAIAPLSKKKRYYYYIYGLHELINNL